MNAPLADDRIETVETPDARREWWFGDLYSQAFAVIRYAETVQSLVEVRDTRGLRYAVNLMNLKAVLAQKAIDAISKIDADALKSEPVKSEPVKKIEAAPAVGSVAQ
jgi:hypothetical protein